MTAPRIAPLEPPFEPEIAEPFAVVMPPGREPLLLFRTLARNKRVLLRIFAGGLLDRGTITLEERELVILRTCARCGSEYEWGVHIAFFAARVGFSAEQVAATAAGVADDAVWSPRQRLLLCLVDELHDSASVSDALWSALAAEWSPEQLLELVVLAGYYHTISFVTNAFQIERETYAARFPGTS
jgi:4-carboxymuconolactone decarboxylase